MELEKKKKKKRGREGENETETEMECLENSNKAKKRDMYGMKDVEEEGCSHLAFGVFDFPWLKDGVTFKSEDYLFDFEDYFSSSLQQEDANFEAAEASKHHIPEAKLEDNAWETFESDLLELQAEDLDCIWTSLLNQPL
ncbi:uncharacterized protein LOC133299414 [Gastrolobium bilobum]|uniref:uncharacterized protein LOC133299414 n=1 Tax=Gastrolobium bilobum TaxID=150636 RepID=UPI002AB084AA|nr:uncharacterized protein LOC133299414 [Gastrolobium bilobum]